MNDLFTTPSHHDILLLLVQLTILLFSARVMGEIAQRLRQPSVVGEILAGIILGPSLLSGFFPFLEEWIVPQTAVQGFLLETVSLIGAMLLLLITGLETDLTLIRRHARTAFGVSLGGVLVTLSGGFVLGQLLPDFLLAHPDHRLVFSLFLAIALSISSIPVIAKVLMELNLMRRDVGQTILAASMSDDTIGWILLSMVAGLAGGQAITAVSVVQEIVKVVGFFVVSLTLGRWLVKQTLDFVQDELASPNRLLTLVVLLMFAWAAITQALNLEAVLGAFVMGILFAQMPRLPDAVIRKLEDVTLGIFAPIFFAVAGLKVNALDLLNPTLIAILLVVLLVGIFSKVTGIYLGARLIGKRDHWTALSFGAGLTARGAMGIIIASIGLSLEILNQDTFSLIVLMSILTSLIAPVALRWALKRVEPSEEEMKRLRHEELTKKSVVAGIHRVLLPVRRRNTTETAVQTIEARLLEMMGAKNSLSLTLLNIATPGQRATGMAFLQHLRPLFSQKEILTKVVESTNLLNTILEEAAKDYDLLVLGASERTQDSDALFSHLVDDLVRMSPCLTMVVKGPRLLEEWHPRRILVPTNGRVAARHAAEIAFNLANGDNRTVVLLHVIEHNPGAYHYREDVNEEVHQRRMETAEQIVNELAELGRSLGVQTEQVVHVATNIEGAIIDMARQNDFNLIILGTDLRPGSTRLFFGPRVEHILEYTPCPVIVLDAA